MLLFLAQNLLNMEQNLTTALDRNSIVLLQYYFCGGRNREIGGKTCNFDATGDAFGLTGYNYIRCGKYPELFRKTTGGF